MSEQERNQLLQRAEKAEHERDELQAALQEQYPGVQSYLQRQGVQIIEQCAALFDIKGWVAQRILALKPSVAEPTQWHNPDGSVENKGRRRYKYIECGITWSTPRLSVIAEWDADGWDLVCIVPAVPHTVAEYSLPETLIFKRPII